MRENQKRILDMLARGKISVSEAQSLLSLTGTEKESRDHNTDGSISKAPPRYLYVMVEAKPGAPPRRAESGRDRPANVKVRIPFGLIRAGMKLATLIPSEAAGKVNAALKQKGMDFDLRRMKPENLEELIIALRENEINVDSDYETVRIYAE
jgi:hypothetical protein